MVAQRAEVDDHEGPFDIYETADGPRHVVNPVRRMILNKMRGAELTVPEIIAATDLTKSTISTHLNVLYRQHMVAYREDPQDRRRKRYFLTARHVATTRRRRDRGAITTADESIQIDASAVVPRLLLRAFVAELTSCGLDMGPVVRETGRRVGEMAARSAGPVDEPAEWARRASAFWASGGLGELAFDDGDPWVARVRNCQLCCASGAPSGLCSIAAGILEGMGAEALGADVRVEKRPDDEQDHGTNTTCGCQFEVMVSDDGRN